MATSQWIIRSPSPVLRPFVTKYIGYRMLGHPPALHRGLPSQNMTMIFSIGPTIDIVSQTNPKHDPRRHRAVLGGLHDSPALIAHDGNQEGVAVQLSPLGSRALLGLPASELWDLTVEADEVIGQSSRDLSERLRDANDWEQRFSACDHTLTGLIGERRAPPELAHTWDLLVRTGGRVAVAHLADEVGYSRQHLRQRFSREFGLGPKRAARLIRFGRAARLLEVSSPPRLAELAVACGYYDQAHMHREFTSLAGCTPVELAAGDLPILQDDPAA